MIPTMARTQMSNQMHRKMLESHRPQAMINKRVNAIALNSVQRRYGADGIFEAIKYMAILGGIACIGGGIIVGVVGKALFDGHKDSKKKNAETKDPTEKK